MDTISKLFERNREFAQSFDDSDIDVHAPEFVSVCCCDARVPQETLFGTSPGSHFTVANIGNSVRTRDDSGEPVVAGSVLYPILETDPEVLFVVGHTDCGAVTAGYRQVADGIKPDRRELQNELDLLCPHLERGLERIDTSEHSDFEIIVRLAEYNVDRQVETLVDAVDDFPVVGAICDLHGVYPGESGEVHLLNYGGTRDPNDVPEPLLPYFERKLEY